MKIKKGDTVKIVTGKDKGKTGTVARAIPALGLVIIDGVNMKKRHQRPRKSGAKGQVIDKPMPIDVSNVMILDPKKEKPTRIAIQRENGKRVRVAKKSGAVIAK